MNEDERLSHFSRVRFFWLLVDLKLCIRERLPAIKCTLVYGRCAPLDTFFINEKQKLHLAAFNVFYRVCDKKVHFAWVIAKKSDAFCFSARNLADICRNHRLAASCLFCHDLSLSSKSFFDHRLSPKSITTYSKKTEKIWHHEKNWPKEQTNICSFEWKVFIFQ